MKTTGRASRRASASVSWSASSKAFLERLRPSRASRSVASSSMASATIVLKTVTGKLTDWLEPTARNSNLLPVKAKGLVRLRSPAWRGIVGSEGVPSPSRPEGLLSEALPASVICSMTSVSWSPRKTERMAGGASLAPSRWSLGALAMAARSRPWWR